MRMPHADGTGGYIPDTFYEVMLGDKSRNVKLTGLLAEARITSR